jgi:hypothetical protein
MNPKDYPEAMKKYMDKMAALVKTHNYESPDKPGTLPRVVIKSEKTYSLLDTLHGYTCDIPHCQALFQMSDSLENGLSATYYPMLPMYTCDFKGELCGLCIHK